MPDRATTATFLQGLTGLQPLIVLMFLSVGGRAQTMDEMRSLTGKSDDALQPALNSLEIKGFVTKQVGEHGRRSYLPGGSSFFGLFGQSLFLPDQNPLLPDSDATTTTLINRQLKTSEVVVEAAHQNPLFADSVSACRSVGIGEPKASKISDYSWVTPDFIREHVAALGEGDKIGLAILRIENNELPPKRIIPGVVVRTKSFAQEQLDALRDDAADEPGKCVHLNLVGHSKRGEVHRICGVATAPGYNRCSLHGGV